MQTKPPVAKPPSKLLTEYYGSLFFLMVLLFLLAAFVVLKPMLDDVKSANAQVVSTLETLANETAYLNSLDQSIAAAQSIPPDVLRKVDRALPRTQGIPELLMLFSSTGDRDHVKISNISFSDAAPGRVTTSSVSELTVNLTVVAAGYPDIKKFLRDLEASLRIMDVIGINVSTQGTESAYALQLKTYAYTPRSR
jgi:Tfp pilus assembly protein PilO